MSSIVFFYQNIPLHINPMAFRIGFFQIGWYGLSYLVAFGVVYGLVKYRLVREEGDIFQISNYLISNSPNKIPNSKFQIPKANNCKLQTINHKLLGSFFLYAILGVLIGGRLGYVLFYNLPYYLKNPIEVISPYNFSTHLWTGIYGMSYHGGLIAIILITLWFCRKNKISFLNLSDLIVPAIPAGYFFGRLGNFLNGELYGRITQSHWGMYFQNVDGLRFPSQIIEAIFEGAVIFIILWIFRNKPFLKGRILFLYVFLYGLARFVAEFFREPDWQIGFFWNWLTLGQILSLIMIFGGIFLFFSRKWYNKMQSIK